MEFELLFEQDKVLWQAFRVSGDLVDAHVLDLPEDEVLRVVRQGDTSGDAWLFGSYSRVCTSR